MTSTTNLPALAYAIICVRMLSLGTQPKMRHLGTTSCSPVSLMCVLCRCRQAVDGSALSEQALPGSGRGKMLATRQCAQSGGRLVTKGIAPVLKFFVQSVAGARLCRRVGATLICKDPCPNLQSVAFRNTLARASCKLVAPTPCSAAPRHRSSCGHQAPKWSCRRMAKR